MTTETVYGLADWQLVELHKGSHSQCSHVVKGTYYPESKRVVVEVDGVSKTFAEGESIDTIADAFHHLTPSSPGQVTG